MSLTSIFSLCHPAAKCSFRPSSSNCPFPRGDSAREDRMAGLLYDFHEGVCPGLPYDRRVSPVVSPDVL